MSESESRPRYAGPAIVRPGEATGRAAQPIPRLISRSTVLKRIKQWVAADTANRKFQQFRPGSTNYFHNGEAKLWASPTDCVCGSLGHIARAFGLLSDKEELARPKQTPITGPLELITTESIELCRSDASGPERFGS